MTRLALRPSSFLLALSLASAALAGGPPLLAVQRAEPGSREARAGAAYVVRASQCGEALGAAVTARAEGVVDGKPQRLDVSLVPTGETGKYLLKRSWPARGEWTLVVSVDSHGHATLLVKDSPAGPVASRLVPDRPTAAVVAAFAADPKS